MRHAVGAVTFLLAVGAIPALAFQLPAYCGAVGANSYTPPIVNVPAVVLNRGTVITVTNATMAINGDTSSVQALMANPGPDGISLQEAVIATNNDPGTWNIQFAPALKGSTIVVDSGTYIKGLSGLAGGNVTINGDIDGDGLADITLTSQSGNGAGIYVSSGGNTLYGLVLQNFSYGVWISPQPSALGTLSNITVSNLAMTNIQGIGIGVNPPSPSSANNLSGWDHIVITGNTISGNAAGPVVGIDLELGATGATMQHSTIANNNIVLPMPGAGTVGIAMNFGAGIGSANNQATDTLIAGNSISVDPSSIGIRIATGVGSASGNLIDGMQVIGNQIGVLDQSASGNGFGAGINLVVGDAASDDAFPSLLPIQYSENNIARNIGILANTIGGAANFGISASAACCGNGNNTIENLSILGNTMVGNTMPGVQLEGGSSGGYYSRPSTGNILSNVLIQANTISSPLRPVPFPGDLEQAIFLGAGIFVIAGLQEPGNSVNGISIGNNDVNTQRIGINLVAGLGHGGPGDTNTLFPSDNNIVTAAQIFCNQIDQLPAGSGISGITVTAGLDAATGSQVQQLYIADNLVAGVLGGASTLAYVGSGGSGNTLTTSATPTPAISFVANAEGQSPVIAPNTWIEIQGVNLAPNQDALNVRTWTTPDFVNNLMPTQLDGAGVTVNGKSAYTFYVSPSQINALTPPDTIDGSVDVVVTNNGVSSAPFVAQAQALSPSFFVFDGTHVVATHLNGADIGPATLYPGLTTPAQPGETIVLFANGFGATSTPVASGAETQSGSLTPTPVITIGGIPANVRFAGLNVTPGEFQFNVDVPANVPDGDQPVTATYNGLATQPGVLLAVQHQ